MADRRARCRPGVERHFAPRVRRTVNGPSHPGGWSCDRRTTWRRVADRFARTRSGARIDDDERGRWLMSTRPNARKMPSMQPVSMRRVSKRQVSIRQVSTTPSSSRRRGGVMSTNATRPIVSSVVVTPIAARTTPLIRMSGSWMPGTVLGAPSPNDGPNARPGRHRSRPNDVPMPVRPRPTRDRHSPEIVGPDRRVDSAVRSSRRDGPRVRPAWKR